ncbi:MAG: gluconeogenesis factor YvcK family protein [Patescibacteria group bacterium]
MAVIIAGALGGALLALTAADAGHGPLPAFAGLAGLTVAWLTWRGVQRGFLTGLWEGGHAPPPAHGPRIVVIGGGTGLGTIIRGLKDVTDNLTAIVTVADDGGSSGRLRQEFGILPPGDIRNCIIAMADLEPLMEQLLQYRFNSGSGLAGHNFGNLFLTAMTGITGDFELAVKELSKVLAVRGQVLPATLEDVSLRALMKDGTEVRGESSLRGENAGIERIFLDPGDCKPVPEALAAIAEADLIVMGPGSLYTSVIPNLLVREIGEAVRRASGLRVYVCNAMTEPGETTGYAASDHVRALLAHGGEGLLDLVLVNTEPIPPELEKAYAQEGAAPVEADTDAIAALGVAPLSDSLIVKQGLVRHDAAKLSRILLGLLRVRRLAAGPKARWRRRFHRTLRSLATRRGA